MIDVRRLESSGAPPGGERFGLRVSRRRILALAASLCVPWRAFAADTRPQLPARFDPTRDAAADLETALRIARAAGTRVLIDVGGEWCAWCHILDRFFAANPEVRQLRDANYVWLKINFSRENRNESFIGRWPDVAGYPHFFVLESDGRLLHSQDTGALEAGRDYDPAAMRAFLVRWAPSR